MGKYLLKPIWSLALDPDTFLKLSRMIFDLPLSNKLDFHIVRYKFFYDSSPRKHNCTYAKMTRQLFETEKEKQTLLLLIKVLPDTERVIKLLEEL